MPNKTKGKAPQKTEQVMIRGILYSKRTETQKMEDRERDFWDGFEYGYGLARQRANTSEPMRSGDSRLAKRAFARLQAKTRKGVKNGKPNC
jgi:hypothetical protein